MKLSVALVAAVAVGAVVAGETRGAIVRASDAFAVVYGGGVDANFSFGYSTGLPSGGGFTETLYTHRLLDGFQVLTNSGDSDLVPGVFYNPGISPASVYSVTLAPGQLALHPGQGGEYSFVKFVAPEAGQYTLNAAFTAGADSTGATTDIYAFVGSTQVGSGAVNGYLSGGGGVPTMADVGGVYSLAAGEALTVFVGYGSNGTYFNDTTAAVNGGITVSSVSDSVPIPEAGVMGGVVMAVGVLLRRVR